jgi:hypothetical protein
VVCCAVSVVESNFAVLLTIVYCKPAAYIDPNVCIRIFCKENLDLPQFFVGFVDQHLVGKLLFRRVWLSRALTAANIPVAKTTIAKPITTSQTLDKL